MKCLVGLAILAAVVAAPTHAQTAHSVGASAQTGATNAGGAGFGGGGFGGGGFGGGSFGSRLASVPPARFDMVIASGSQQSYVPSTFLPYDKAITAGRDVLDVAPTTVAEASQRQASAHTEKARYLLTQDEHGRAVIVPR